MDKIKGYLVLLAAQSLAFVLATVIHGWLRGHNFSDVGVAMYSNNAWAVLAGILVIALIGLSTASLLQRTLLKGSGIVLWVAAVGLTFLSVVIFALGGSF